MAKKLEEKMYEVFAKAFHEIVIPILENKADKKDLENLATKDDIAKIETKLDKHEDRMDRHGQTLDIHEKRIKGLEKITSVLN